MGLSAIAGWIGRIIYGLCLLAAGGGLAWGGIQLLSLGGSLYYLPAGLAALATGAAVLFGRWRLAGWLYFGLLAVTLVWSLMEAGLNGWALMPRLVSPFVLGLPLLVLALLRGEKGQRRAGLGVVAAAVVLVATVWISSGFQATEARTGEAVAVAQSSRDWLHFGNSLGGNFHSSLSQVDHSNVGKLKVAWQRNFAHEPVRPVSQMQTVPLRVGERLFACNSFGQVFALDAVSGDVLWEYDSDPDFSGLAVIKCRGVAYHALPEESGTCSQRIYGTSVGGKLTALDAETGKLCPGFGQDGQVDLTRGLKQPNTGYYWLSSAPTVADGKLIIGGGVADGQMVGEPSGVIRAFDAVTGRLAWAWDLGNPGVYGEPAEGEFYTSGTPNAWGPISADEELGLAYVPTGNSTPDYWAGHRTAESNTYGSSIVALDLATGEPRWHFQTTHYDIWDYDIASQPVLIDLRKDGRVIPAVVVNTKRGQVYVLDRRSGKPVYPIEEKPAPQAGAVEKLSPTQPWSTALPDLGASNLTEAKMWGVTALDQLWCRIKFREARYDGTLTPLSERYAIVDPGYTGGVNWGSFSYDPDRQLAFGLSNRFVNRVRLVPRSDPLASKYKAGSANDQSGLVPQEGTPYAADIKPFMSPVGVPCQQPPHGLISAIDLATGKLVWERPLGTARDLGPMMTPSRLPFTIGTITFGGTMTTAGGLVFVGGSQDHSFRAFDGETGKMLFEADLPGNSNTRPMTFKSDKDGRQYIVVASDAPMSDGKIHETITAFALPAG
ncbi:MAG: PQQ-binding-like beta-propeller repeat protein [Novosphingobium sp.]|nr:PQQ-binding-like beta-propeller repeat protein [Novosphingobium sp.]